MVSPFQVQKVYLKSRLNCVLLAKGFNQDIVEKEREEEVEGLDRSEAKECSDEDEVIEVDDGDDSMWDSMETVKTGDGTKRKVVKEQAISCNDTKQKSKKKR